MASLLERVSFSVAQAKTLGNPSLQGPSARWSIVPDSPESDGIGAGDHARISRRSCVFVRALPEIPSALQTAWLKEQSVCELP